jgi:hypothetical protein
MPNPYLRLESGTVDLVATQDAGEGERRIIAGTLMRWDEDALIAGERWRFTAGALEPRRARTPVTIGHDRNRPVGVVSELTDLDGAARCRLRIDATPEGDTALIQAASGSRASLSIGAEPVDYTPAENGFVCTRALVDEVALVSAGAFASAEIDTVLATLEGGDMPADAPPVPDHTGTIAPAPALEAGGAPAPVLEAAAPIPRIVTSERPAAPLSAGELVSLIIRAQHGEAEAHRYLAAALTETISTDVSGLLPPVYEREVIGAKEVPRPLYETFRSKPLPGVGLAVTKPVWTTPPAGAWALNVDADATTSKVVIGAQTANVQRWDWAGAMSWVVVQRSDPNVIDETYAAAVTDFHLDVETSIYGQLNAAAAGTATTLGAAIAEFYNANGNSRSPDVIIMAPDVWGKFADAGKLNVSVGAGDVSGSDLTTSFAGIRAITSGTLAAAQVILATRRAVDARVTEPVRLTANAIGALNIELAVVGEGLFDTDYPLELRKFAAIVPAVAGESAPPSRSR